MLCKSSYFLYLGVIDEEGYTKKMGHRCYFKCFQRMNVFILFLIPLWKEFLVVPNGLREFKCFV